MLRIFTPDGFVVAADGLKRKLADDGAITIVSGSTQKLFPIEENGRSLAYALTGTTATTSGESDEVQFDFLTEAAEAIQSRGKAGWRDDAALLTWLASL